MKQTIGNACGTIGIIHSIANNTDRIALGLHAHTVAITSHATEGFMKDFLEKAKNVSPDERAALLEADTAIAVAHEESAQQGQTEVCLDVCLFFVFLFIWLVECLFGCCLFVC